MKPRYLSFALLVVAASASCAKKKDASTTATTPSTVAAGSGGSPTTTTSSGELTTIVAANIGTVQENMVPGSLVTTSSTSLALDDDSSNPCANTNGLFDCQPNLLKLYLATAQTIVGETQKMVAAAGTKLNQLTLPANGSVTPDNTSVITEIDYNATSATAYSLLFHGAAAPFMELQVDGGQYILTADFSKGPDFDPSSGPSWMTSTINFTDQNNFTIDVKLGGFPCSAQDVGSPNAIAVNLAVVDGVWQGKAMLYLPRWLGSNTCTTTPTAATKMFIYSDFVGDATNTTMALYMMPDTVTAATAFSTYAATNFCTNFSGECTNGKAGFDSGAVSSYGNPACITPNAGGGWGSAATANWGSPCTSTNTEISTPTYSDASLWTLPSDLESLTVTVPASLPVSVTGTSTATGTASSTATGTESSTATATGSSTATATASN